jgi:hypothetical protein
VIREWYHEVRNNEGRIRDFKDFVHEDFPKDMSGHGTHIAGIILDLSSNTHVYVGRVVESQKHLKRSGNTFRHQLVQVCGYVPCLLQLNLTVTWRPCNIPGKFGT